MNIEQNWEMVNCSCGNTAVEETPEPEERVVLDEVVEVLMFRNQEEMERHARMEKCRACCPRLQPRAIQGGGRLAAGTPAKKGRRRNAAGPSSSGGRPGTSSGKMFFRFLVIWEIYSLIYKTSVRSKACCHVI